MLGRVVKIERKNLTLAPVIVWKNKEPSTFTWHLWNAVIKSYHKMEMKYSDRGTLIKRQRYPLSSRSPLIVLTDEPLRKEHNFTTFSV